MRVVIATGGTGGHIYPALSLVDSLKSNGLDEVLFIGSVSRMEAKEIPLKGYRFIGLDVIGTNGGIINKFKSIYLMLKARNRCMQILKDFKPDIVIGFGNYISVPVIMAAKALRIKTMIHEQNSVAGKANRFLAKHVDGVVGSYEENLKDFKNCHVRILGNPRASEAYKVKKDASLLKQFDFKEILPLVVIVMGSLGSSSVSKVLMEYAVLFNSTAYQVLIVTGDKHYDDFKINENAYLKKVKYIDGLSIMALADLLVIRSGATTCAEVCALGKASISIPSPYVPNNHQMINAETLKRNHATIIIKESDLTAALLNETINRLMNDEKGRSAMGNNACKIAKVRASEDIIKWIKEMII